MRSQLRNWDSKITFFAFADIITAVSGMLIFITLLLATGLGQQSPDRAAAAAIQHQLEETLAQQATSDAKNARMESLLSSAQSAPSVSELQTDVGRLRSQVDEEARKQAAVIDQLAGSQARTASRDRELGLTDLRAEVQRVRQETEAVAVHEVEVRDVVKSLENQILRLRTALVRLSERDGQLWLIPDKNGMSKEPILVTVGAKQAVIERFNHPDQRAQLKAGDALPDLESYLHKANSATQYVVFLIRPSGIALFHDLVQRAHGMGFEVGYDAIDEGQQIHFSTPPPVEELPETKSPPPATEPTSSSPPSEGATTTATTKPPSVESAAKVPEPQPAAPKAQPPPPAKKSWWQRLLEWLGLA